jgi:hypothetical protein
MFTRILLRKSKIVNKMITQTNGHIDLTLDKNLLI